MRKELLEEAAREALVGIKNKDGGPFGAIITDKDGNIVGRGHNMVIANNDPTAHAEVMAIRDACNKLKTHDLSDYYIYSSCEPCPMCLSAIVWSNIKVLYYGASRIDADRIGFRDKLIYDYFNNDNCILSKDEIEVDLCKKILDEYKGEMY